MSRPWPSRDDCLRALHEGDGHGVIVAVLDTGLDRAHPDFHSLRLAGTHRIRILDGQAGIIASDGTDPVGHGTAVTGIIHSLAPAAEIHSIAVLDADQRQHRHEVIRHGARFAVEQGAAILNCSFGVVGNLYGLPIYKDWTDEAFHRDRIVVAASSNVSTEIPEWPAWFAQVIGVTAGDGGRCSLSEPCRKNHITLAAPGAEIPAPTPGGGHATFSGSSFAAAHVTGLLARLLSAYPGITPSLAREALEQHAAGHVTGP